jgi:uncharacterized protein YkwD
MPDTFSIRNTPRRNFHPLGTNRKKKYLKLFLLAVLVGIAGTAYFAYTSGIFADANAEIPPQLLDRVNLERQNNNLEPLQYSESLAGAAMTKSQDVRISPLAYQPGSKSSDGTNVFIVSKISWALSRFDSRQTFADTFENSHPDFRDTDLNPGYHGMGSGVSSDAYNYYIVTMVQ